MKLANYITYAFILSIVLTACYDKEDPLDDIITKSGKYYPVIANIRTLENQGYTVDYTPGGTVALELQYWSLDPIDQINFYEDINGTVTLLESQSYNAAFSQRAGTDTLVYQYIIPAATPVDTGIDIIFEIVNNNGLSIDDNFGFTVE